MSELVLSFLRALIMNPKNHLDNRGALFSFLENQAWAGLSFYEEHLLLVLKK
jgi:hypothetical protein